jgi:transcription-repair coupling factor (superfamily II helicase)
VSPTLAAIADAVARGPVIAHGATRGWAAAAIATLRRATPPGTPVIAVVADDEAARALDGDVAAMTGEAPVLLPGIDVSPYAELSPDRDAIVARLAALVRLAGVADDDHAHPPPGVVIATASALLRRTVPADALRARTFAIVKGAAIDRDATAARLVAAGFARVPTVEDPGTFAVRGGVIDVFSPVERYPVRVELFGDDVETLRLFDPLTQRTLREIDHVLIHPARETIVTAAGGQAAVRARIRDVADAVAHPSKATRALLDRLDDGGEIVGLEVLTPAFHDRMDPPWALIPPDARWVLVDPDAVVGAARDEHADAARRHDARVAAHGLALPVDAHYATPDELDAALAAPRHRLVLPTLELAHDPRAAGAEVVRLALDDLRGLAAELERARVAGCDELGRPLAAFVARHVEAGARVAIVCDGAVRADRIAGLLAHYGVHADRDPAAEAHALDARPGAVTIALGHLADGFASAADGLVVLSTAPVFGARRAAPRQRAAAKKARDALLGGVSDFSQLAPGDHLVHQLHGVGRYVGLVKLPIGAIALDFLHLQYDGGTLYLPVYRLGEVQRHVGAEGHAPRLDKLGGLTWDKARTKASRQVRALAEELLQLWATRAALPGHRFPPADDMFHDFEAAFPFEETPDQQAAIDAVLADMESPRAMDRLVCGDVGYGKTEVALRAIFRAASGGKQAALLAPTTVLVEQHARTLTERLAPWPLRVGKLSRFQSKAEQAATVKALADGGLDVVVGTHRLLSPDVRFKDLGLIVIDEEQRFGVAHKERLKKLRASVDVLTLTATPIPRTLHLAMAGLRDLSIIATPPADRHAVRTYVSRLDEGVVTEAIRKELARGGQVFWIARHIGETRRGAHDPDDRSLAEWAQFIRERVPDARVAIAHGQLGAEELEDVMVAFVEGKHDVLVSTTIVESGLDIPRANTMFVARADAFGLAQLYQLRGRIGRSKQRAFCYLLVPAPDKLTDEARRRLEALQRFTELGAGFHIASQDLEIRGGGELLGARQSGTLAAVGFDQYVRMLEGAVAELRGQPVHHPIDPELTVEVPGFIPDDYVPDPGQRLDLYKRLSSAEDEDEVRAVLDEIADRYGPPPGDLLLLADLMVVKALARGLHAVALELTRGRLALALAPSTPLDGAALARDRASRWKATPDGRLVIALSTDEARAPAQAARRLLLELSTRGT